MRKLTDQQQIDDATVSLSKIITDQETELKK
jgi:structural maintenance of chromosome 1